MAISDLVEFSIGQLTAKSRALESASAELDRLKAARDTILNEIMPLLASNDSAERYAEFHLIKRSGEFGGYGLNAAIERMELLTSSLDGDVEFLKNAIAMYHALDKGYDIGEMPHPPGCVSRLECSIFSNDKDHPESEYQLRKSADYHLVNRKAVDADGCLLSEEMGGAAIYLMTTK